MYKDTTGYRQECGVNYGECHNSYELTWYIYGGGYQRYLDGKNYMKQYNYYKNSSDWHKNTVDSYNDDFYDSGVFVVSVIVGVGLIFYPELGTTVVGICILTTEVAIFVYGSMSIDPSWKAVTFIDEHGNISKTLWVEYYTKNDIELVYDVRVIRPFGLIQD